jgi:hypothetical protein
LGAGGTVLRKIVFETRDEHEAYQKEMSLIHLIGLNNLTNRLPGGPGKKIIPALDKHLCDMSLDEFDLYMRRLRPSKKEHDILVRRWMRVRISLLTSERMIARGHGDYEQGDILDQEIKNIYAAYSKPWQEGLRF